MARADVFDYIEIFHNQTRRHSQLGGVSPEAFERASKWALDLSMKLWEVQFQNRGIQIEAGMIGHLIVL